ncbi:response regulator, putative virR [Anaerovibrio sp. JC8]|uniref:LytR/AlgR family response regulator transcription factor n=1 Tax=Anaerovibrio sp. JC8 TaxID=1240085 RepID=UPI000A0DCDA1|nr:LytTR family DNA-binding domain-containing protein [Anaerovibrio sp. JC8]ORU00846.1 response regulator, putative virR [Anaerovibrio sp. JC8]
MRIAIADDLETDLQVAASKVRQYIEAAYPEAMKNFELDTFPSAEALLESFEAGKYELLILDIFMADMTGMEAAEAIRLQDEKVPIVFLTTSQDYMLEGYRVFAAGYLLKPLTEHLEEFSHTMGHILPSILEEECFISTTVNGEELEVLVSKIVYLDINVRHKLCIHLVDTVFETPMLYHQCQELLIDRKNFIECHHRIIINMDYVKRMEADSFLMQNGDSVPISQRRKKETKALFMHYLVHR